MTPDEEDQIATHVDSEGDEGDEVEEEEEEEEEARDAKKRSREAAELEEGMTSSSVIPPEEPKMVKPLAFMAPLSESGERALKKKKVIYTTISMSW